MTQSIAGILESLQSLVEVNWPRPSKGDAVYKILHKDAQSALRDATERRQVKVLYRDPTPGMLILIALNKYHIEPDSAMYKFRKITGLSQLNVDRIAMAGMEAGL